ncbi:LysM domain-containing protein [Mycena leptocephala]|nr:LysM domain-containing protein [Mycena leptocephala]
MVCKIPSGDSSTAVDEKLGIALADLLRWNKALTSACTTTGLDEAYCVAGGGAACSKIYAVVSGDSCGLIESKFGITLANIFAWNPFLDSSCAIQIGQNLCVL